MVGASILSFLFEVFDTDSAGWTCPAFREVFKCGSRSYSSLRIAFCRIINVSADYTYISIHDLFVFVDSKSNFQAMHLLSYQFVEQYETFIYVRLDEFNFGLI